MLLRIMNHLPSGTDSPERFQISVLYRISLMVSIGILHKFNPSIFNSTAVSPNMSGTFGHLARSPAANGIFVRVHIKRRQPMPTIHVLPPFYPIIIYLFPSGSRQDFLSLLRSPRYQSAECQKRQYIRNNHKPVKEVCQGPYKFQLQAGTDHDADNDDQGVKL